MNVEHAIEPRQAAAWLRANGWELLGTTPRRSATWRKSAGAEGDFLIELPLDPTFRDYPCSPSSPGSPSSAAPR